MTSHILTFIEGPCSNFYPTLLPLPEADLEETPDDLSGSTLVLPEWPDTHMSPFDRWEGAIMIVPDSDAGSDPPSLARIILASADAIQLRDLSEWIIDLAVQARSRLMLLVVLALDEDQGSTALKRIYDESQQQLSEIASGMRARGIQANWEVRFGSLGEETVRLAETTGTAVAAVRRPAEGEESGDFAQLLIWIREHRPDLHILVSPPDA